MTETEKFGASIGSPISQSLSPIIHNAAYATLGLHSWRYGKFEVKQGELASFIASLEPNCIGLSVTMPLKREALAFADTSSERARLVGAANTLLPQTGSWHADNTDAPGMVDALREAGLRRADQAVILGAGGTAQAALVALREFTSEPVNIAVRESSRAHTALATAQRCGLTTHVIPLAQVEQAIAQADLVISTLPAGVADQFSSAQFQRQPVVFDVLYQPWPTVFAEAAQQAGCRIVSGLDLLVHQATYQVRAMTGKPAPLEAMRYALSERIRSQKVL